MNEGARQSWREVSHGLDSTSTLTGPPSVLGRLISPSTRQRTAEAVRKIHKPFKLSSDVAHFYPEVVFVTRKVTSKDCCFPGQ